MSLLYLMLISNLDKTLNEISNEIDLKKIWNFLKLKINTLINILWLLFDCFQYFNEDHIADLRFNILNNFVDKFVIVESNC